MPFIRFDEVEKEVVTPKHSTAYGELVTGSSIEVGRLSFKAGEGAERHNHPHEQIMIVLSGKLRVDLDGDVAELAPGSGFHAPSDVPHQVTAVADSQVLSCKNVIGSQGHRQQ